MQTPKGRLSWIMAEEGFEIVPNNRRPCHDGNGPIQVHFSKAAEIIWKLRGEQHLRFILQCLKAHRGKLAVFKSDIVWSLSDILAVRPDWLGNGRFQQRVQAMDLEGIRNKNAARRPWPVKIGVRTDLMNDLEACLDAAS